MQIWDNLLIFLLVSFNCIVVQFALFYPTVGEFFFVLVTWIKSNLRELSVKLTLSPPDKNDNGTYKGTMTLVSMTAFTKDWRQDKIISYVNFCQLQMQVFVGLTPFVWMCN